MISGILAYRNIQNSILNGVKIPHSTSQPLIFGENGKYYLAVFVFFFSREDIETGKIIEIRQTKNKEFSDASYKIKYNVRADAQYDTSKKYYEKAFAILDSCRNEIINTDRFNPEEYKHYLDMIVANIPKEYQRFYFDLSV